MAKAMIYQPDKNAMQSGMAKAGIWLLKFKPEKPYFVDNLMGWVGMSDMPQEVQISFPTRQAAMDYATLQNIPYEIAEPHKRRVVRKAYADNFKFDRIQEKVS
jgi:hypothetical protein